MASLLETHGWYEWLCHTNFSFLTGASHPHECLVRAAVCGYRGLSVTDLDGVYGLARAHLDLQKMRRDEIQGTDALRLFHGIELHLAQDHDLPMLFRDTLVLIARSRQGYAQLCHLASYAHREGKADAYVPLADLLQHPVTDLVAIQPMRGVIRRAPVAAVEARYAALAEHFGERFHLAVSRHLHPGEDAWLTPTLALARRLGRSCLLSQDAFFHAPAQKDMSDLIQAIRVNKPLDAAVAYMFPNTERCLRPLAILERRFRDLPVYAEALATSRALAESCCFDMSELRYRYPKEMLPEGQTAQGYLEQLVWAALRERYGPTAPGKVSNLLAHELDLIKQLTFADYFLTVWDIVRWARSQGILCQGRGSAANSAVCFVLGITSVDPGLFDLLFERFVSVERGDPPDIDVDFEHERREEVIQYIYRRYGRDKAAMVANVITFRSKGALRAVGKALGVPEHLLGETAQLLEARYFRRSETDDVLEHVREKAKPTNPPSNPQAIHRPEQVEGSISRPRCPEDAKLTELIPWRLWGSLAERLKGFPRHLGIHSGGFMLADEPLSNLVAQEPATMEGRSVVQWSKEDIEGLGFFKIDILALGMLTAVRKCFDAVEAHGGPRLTLAALPPDDPPTYAMIQRADTVGTFQIESRAQMSMLPRLRPKNFYDLVVEVAIIRPGPIQGGMVHPYLRRRDGIEKVSFPDDRLRPILARTLGIPLFQEQVMRIAIAVGDFSPGEANELRRHMGAWSMKGDMGPWIGRLADGMRRNGLAEDFIASILAQMKGFAHYGFPESHAVSFALLAYVSAYLKCHFPAAFFMALLNSQPMGFYAPHALLQSAQRDGVKVLPVCANRSQWDSTLEDVAEAGRPPRPKIMALRLGFRLVTGLRRVGADLLLARRAAAGSFRDLAHLLQTAPLHRGDLTALAAADAFAAFGLPRRGALWIAEAAPFCERLEDVDDTPTFAEETPMERAEQDFTAAQTTLGPHPVLIIREQHWCYPLKQSRLTTAKDLAAATPGRSVDVFGMVLVRQSPPSAKGMVFFTMEDASGFINLAFTPETYARHYELVEKQSFLCVRGRLQRQNEYHSVMVTDVYAPEMQRGEVLPLTATVTRDNADRIDPREDAPSTKVLTPARNYM